MVIKLNKLHIFITALFAITLSFTFAMISEKRSVQVSSSPSAEVPIIMYHHITKNIQKSGKYTVTTDEFENDLKYLTSKGYTSVTVKDLTDFVYSGSSLPQKPIMITFDDGFESFYTLAYPLLKKYNFKAVLSIIGFESDKYSAINDHNINYSNLNWSEIKEMSDSGVVEIQNHTYNLHENQSDGRKGMLPLKNENEQEYINLLTNDLLKLQFLISDKLGTQADAIAYPFGAYTDATKEIIRNLGFRCSFTCEERVNVIKQNDAESLFELGRYNRKSGISSEKFFKKIF